MPASPSRVDRDAGVAPTEFRAASAGPVTSRVAMLGGPAASRLQWRIAGIVGTTLKSLTR
jgi:hypothetical protein